MIKLVFMSWCKPPEKVLCPAVDFDLLFETGLNVTQFWYIPFARASEWETSMAHTDAHRKTCTRTYNTNLATTKSLLIPLFSVYANIWQIYIQYIQIQSSLLLHILFYHVDAWAVVWYCLCWHPVKLAVSFRGVKTAWKLCDQLRHCLKLRVWTPHHIRVWLEAEHWGKYKKIRHPKYTHTALAHNTPALLFLFHTAITTFHGWFKLFFTGLA